MPRPSDCEARQAMLPEAGKPEQARACEEAPDICAVLLTLASVLLVVVTLPFSLCCIVKVVQVVPAATTMVHHQEYEKSVIFRLGRILTGGPRGPGVFFIIPCVDIYQVITIFLNLTSTF